MLMHMRTTLNIDDSLLRNAAKLTGVKEKTSLVRLGLEALGRSRRDREVASRGSQTAPSQRRMILVDTSVWIEHFRAGNDRLKLYCLTSKSFVIHLWCLGHFLTDGSAA